jgi:hypothetical protein
MTYQDALHKLGNRVSRVIGNNTTLHKCSDGAIAVRLYQTDVVTFWPDGEIKLDSGGCRTVTTKARINEYAPASCHITQRNGQWYLGNVGTNGGPHFYDGLIYHPENNGFNFSLKWNPRCRERTRCSINPTVKNLSPIRLLACKSRCASGARSRHNKEDRWKQTQKRGLNWAKSSPPPVLGAHCKPAVHVPLNYWRAMSAAIGARSRLRMRKKTNAVSSRVGASSAAIAYRTVKRSGLSRKQIAARLRCCCLKNTDRLYM